MPKIAKKGNSIAVALPRQALEALGLQIGAEVIGRRPGLWSVPVHVASVADVQDQDDQAIALALEDDPVITHAQAPFVSPSA